jgi:hypothetical protein
MKKRKNLTKITDYAVPRDWPDHEYWDNLLYELKPQGSSPNDTPFPYALNVVATMTTYRGYSDTSSNVYYLTNNDLERFLTIQYLYWNGIRVFPDGSIKKIREYADGGEEVIYYGKFGGFGGQFENGNKQIYDAHQKMIEDAKKAKEAAKEAAIAERKAKKLAKEKAEYERLKKKFEEENEE